MTGKTRCNIFYFLLLTFVKNRQKDWYNLSSYIKGLSGNGLFNAIDVKQAKRYLSIQQLIRIITIENCS